MATTFLATVIGWYLVVFSCLILFKHQHVKAIVTNIAKQPGQFFILALFTFIIGLLMVVSHNFWILEWSVVITLFSWLILIGGLYRLFCQEAAQKTALAFVKKPLRMRVTAIVLLVIGLYLLAHIYFAPQI